MNFQWISFKQKHSHPSLQYVILWEIQLTFTHISPTNTWHNGRNTRIHKIRLVNTNTKANNAYFNYIVKILGLIYSVQQGLLVGRELQPHGMKIKQIHYLKICYIYFKITPCPHFIFQNLWNPFISVLFHLILKKSPVKLSFHYCYHITYKWVNSNNTWLREDYHPPHKNSGWKSTSLVYFYICFLSSIPIAIALDFVSPSTQHIAGIQWLSREGISKRVGEWVSEWWILWNWKGCL